MSTIDDAIEIVPAITIRPDNKGGEKAKARDNRSETKTGNQIVAVSKETEDRS